MKSILIGAGVVVALVWWNVAEIPNFRIDTSKVKSMPIPESVSAAKLDWAWFDLVETDESEGKCKLVSMPEPLGSLEGKVVVVSGPSFACGDQIVERSDGYSIRGFVMVPYFGMIDCCVGNPIPYYQWTIVVKELRSPWEINHKGIIDPSVVVRGVLRVERQSSQDGIFFLDQAEVIDSVEHQAAQEQLIGE
ncbi:hypothetical protein [Planctomycetes bacterium CA13]|uniref:hypothetical protein n=1 Tax=Novipirellula herctigrandis TaxID=2527986 RepID=UPI0011B839CF